ncbi:ATP-grasp domain-containing protein [Hydrogenophaga sp. 5NK40-0174]|uniref:ATP-grasp domain-containing protein n=1 Tax=Hydrogenophaga sp. 5NK40-0174 TaxID=3127649 RepID=UPI0031044185
MPKQTRALALFNYDWDALGHARAAQNVPALGLAGVDEAGFDLFSFPSNARLAWFDMERFVDRLARKARRKGWTAVTSNHEQFGALAAALLAERMGWPGTPVKAILACQHKWYARQVLQQVAPEANLSYALLNAAYGDPAPEGLRYPAFVKPVKAAFSVLAKAVHNRDELQAHTRFGAWELWVIKRLVEPFERLAQERLAPLNQGQSGEEAALPCAHRMLLEEVVPAKTPQYNLDGYVFKGQAHALGVVDAVMYPGTQAFMRWDVPGSAPAGVQARALDVAQRFLHAVGFTHGMFNMEFFHDPVTDRLSVIEFNPRLASQFSDLYLRTTGVDLHAVSLALALGMDPATLPRAEPVAGAAASLVYRAFEENEIRPQPTPAQAKALTDAFPDADLYPFPKAGGSVARDFKWLGSYRYGIVHLQGRDKADLKARSEKASALLGWPTPWLDGEPVATAAAPTNTTMPPTVQVDGASAMLDVDLAPFPTHTHCLRPEAASEQRPTARTS